MITRRILSIVDSSIMILVGLAFTGISTLPVRAMEDDAFSTKSITSYTPKYIDPEWWQSVEVIKANSKGSAEKWTIPSRSTTYCFSKSDEDLVSLEDEHGKSKVMFRRDAEKIMKNENHEIQKSRNSTCLASHQAVRKFHDSPVLDICEKAKYDSILSHSSVSYGFPPNPAFIFGNLFRYR